MLFYIIPYFIVIIFSTILYNIKSENISKGMFVFLVILPAILVALLRGDIGTDTLNYLGYFEDLRTGESNYPAYEPGFTFLANGISLLGLPDRASIAIVSLITIILLCYSFSRTKSQVLLFCWVVFPLFFVDMTMNGLRYGIAFSVASLSVQAIYDKKILKAIIIGLIAMSLQYSAALIVLPFLLFNLNKKYTIYIIGGLICLVPIIVGLGPFLLKYLYDKQDSYKDLASPGAASGLGPLIMFLILYGALITFSFKNKLSKVIHVLLLFEILSFSLAKISYAGLRFQTLFLFSLLIYVKENFEILNKRNLFMYSLYFMGFLTFLILLKNITAKGEDVQAPMIPYKFFWQTL